MEQILVTKKDEVYMHLTCERHMAMELHEHFSFYVPGFQFSPSFKNKMWNGKIYLYNLKKDTLYIGLLDELEKFCQDRNYKIIVDQQLYHKNKFTVEQAKEFIHNLNLPEKVSNVRDYQISSFVQAIQNKRMLLLSPTASGKSLIIYLIIKYLQENNVMKGLLVVPNTNLCHQMFTDFESYGYDSESNCHIVYSGKEKETDKFLMISTWQSLFRMPSSYFEQFDFVIIDECHLAKAKSLTTILCACTKAKYRLGTTGTLDGTNINKLVIEGLTGKVYKPTSTSELIEKKQLADFDIKCLVLKHHEDHCKLAKKWNYNEEMEYLVFNSSRNKFIKNLALSLKGNSLILFQYVEKHGKDLFKLIKEHAGERRVFLVYGGTDAEERELVRKLAETEENAILVCSYGTFSTGTNIRNLHNIIFASPSKSRIRNLQSIGRGLRLGDNKTKATLFDIADDLRTGKFTNYTLKHFVERVKIYDEEKFNYKLINLELKK